MEKEKTEKFTLAIDLFTGELEIISLDKIPRTLPRGQFIPHREGTKAQMESLERSIISSNLKTLMRNG